MNNFIAVVKGVSGSGKSTRVFLLLDYFKSLGMTLTDFIFVNKKGESKLVGILVEEFNIVFIGKMYQTNGVDRFQGYDVTTSSFGKSSDFSDFLKDHSSKHSFIVEGAGVTASNRLRPKFLNEFCGFKEIFMQYYNYDMSQKEEYLKRIFYRSGKTPIKATMWEKCSGFISDHKKSDMEFSMINDISMSYCGYNLFNTTEYDLGVKLLTFLGSDHLTDGFILFCKNSTYLLDNSFKNFEDAKN